MGYPPLDATFDSSFRHSSAVHPAGRRNVGIVRGSVLEYGGADGDGGSDLSPGFQSSETDPYPCVIIAAITHPLSIPAVQAAASVPPHHNVIMPLRSVGRVSRLRSYP